jgi:hypothetical protein
MELFSDIDENHDNIELLNKRNLKCETINLNENTCTNYSDNYDVLSIMFNDKTNMNIKHICSHANLKHMLNEKIKIIIISNCLLENIHYINNFIRKIKIIGSANTRYIIKQNILFYKQFDYLQSSFTTIDLSINKEYLNKSNGIIKTHTFPNKIENLQFFGRGKIKIKRPPFNVKFLMLRSDLCLIKIKNGNKFENLETLILDVIDLEEIHIKNFKSLKILKITSNDPCFEKTLNLQNLPPNIEHINTNVYSNTKNISTILNNLPNTINDINATIHKFNKNTCIKRNNITVDKHTFDSIDTLININNNKRSTMDYYIYNTIKTLKLCYYLPQSLKIPRKLPKIPKNIELFNCPIME